MNFLEQEMNDGFITIHYCLDFVGRQVRVLSFISLPNLYIWGITIGVFGQVFCRFNEGKNEFLEEIKTQIILQQPGF